jgi:hypothetical protein
MHAKNRLSKLAFLCAALVLIGQGCPRNDTASYTTSQQTWSELTDEERAAVRGIVRTFGELKDKKPEEIRAIQPLTINVMTLQDAVTHQNVILPFPEQQFRLVTPVECPDDCPEDHYVGSEGLTLDLRMFDEPPVSCEWGMRSATTEMNVDQEGFIRWLEEYLKKKR